MGISKEVLDILMAGNARFVEGKPTHPRQDNTRREEIVSGQKPHTAIISCSDSRVPPEIIFDQGLGDLFVIRVAGNIIDDVVMGSVEYAVEHVGVAVVMVLGHSSCGAVTAAVEGGETRGSIGALTEVIQPAISNSTKPVIVDEVARTNVRLMVEKLETSEPILKKFLNTGKVIIVGTFYELYNGRVTIIG